MDRNDYHAYLLSNAWRKKRARVLKRDKICQTCGVGRHLVVHHRTYERVGRERIGDLITLCSACHDTISASIRRRQIDQHWPTGAQGLFNTLLALLR